MASTLFFLFVVQTMLFFDPFSIQHRKIGEGRGGFWQNNSDKVDFPIDLNLPLLKKDPDEEEENEVKPRRPDTKEVSSLNEDPNAVEEKTNLELNLGCGDHSSPSSSAVTHSNNAGPSFSTANHDNDGGALINAPPLQGGNGVSATVTGGGGGGSGGGQLPNGVANDEMEEAEDDYLVVMGCQLCYLYCMVSRMRPECPCCRNEQLIDV